MKKFTKILVLLLSLALILGVIAIVASADETEPTTLDITSTLTGASGTVKLTADSHITSTVDVTNDLTIDLNGYTFNSSVETAFTVNAGVTFTIQGEGAIALDGALVTSTATGTAFTVNVTGSGAGIDITHTGTANGKIVNTFEGTYNVKNVEIVSTATYTSSQGFFHTDSTSAAGAVFNFTATSFLAEKSDPGVDCTAGKTNTSAYSFCVVTGTSGKATINTCNVQVYGHAFSIANAISEDVIVGIENSYVYAASRGATRGTVVYDANATAIGKINISNSEVGASYAVVLFGYSDHTAMKDNLTVNVTGSTIKQSGATANPASGSSADVGKIATNAPFNIDGNSTVLAIGSFGNASVGYVQLGTRSNREFANDAKIIFPDGSTRADSETYTIVFDPITDPDAPYVVAKVGATATLDITQSTTDAPTALSYYAYLNYESTSVRLNSMREDDAFRYGSTGNLVSGTSGGYPSGRFFNNTWGNFAEYRSADNNALKYWLPADAATTITSSAPNFQFTTLTRDNCQTYMSEGAFTVAVFDIDIASDTGVWIDGGFGVGARSSSGVATASSRPTMKSDGTLDLSTITTNVEGKKIQLEKNTWYRFTAVVYGDASFGKGMVYYYLDGELIGTGAASSADSYFLKGIRFDHGKTQAAGASMLFDNIMTRVYTEYVEGDSAAAPTPEKYLKLALKSDKTLGESGNIVIGGVDYDTAAEAITAAAALGTSAELKGDVTVPQLVQQNGIIYTNGYSLAIADGSYAAVTDYYDDATIKSYEFDERYNDISVTYYFYEGEYGNEEQMEDVSYYYAVDFGVGQTPTYKDNYDDIDISYIPGPTYQIATVHGWNDGTTDEPMTFAPVTVNFAAQNPDGVILYPVVTYEDMTANFIVIHEDGTLGNTSTDKKFSTGITSALDMKYGDTLVLNKDSLVYGAININNLADNGENVINIDLNGHTLTMDPTVSTSATSKGVLFNVRANATWNVYSSYEGGMIINKGATNNVKAAGGVTFEVNSYEEIEQADGSVVYNPVDANLNVGKYTKADGTVVPGSNVTISGDCVLSLARGGEGSQIVIDGIMMVRSSTDSSAFMIGNYKGSVEVKNSTYISLIGGDFINSRTNQSNNANGYVLEDGELTYSAGAELSFDNCDVYLKDGDNWVATNYAAKSITVTNCRSNGRFNPSKAKGVCVAGEGNEFVKIDTDITEGIVKAKYTQPMKLDALTDGEVYTYTYYSLISGTKRDLEEKTLTLAVNGYAGEADFTLPKFAYKTVSAEDACTVTWNYETGDTYKVDYYVPGEALVTVTPPTITKDYTAVKKVYDGTFDKELPATVTENITITATGYDFEQNLKGLLSNLTLYASFEVNLYIPAAYGEFITVFAEGNELETTTVTINDAQYIKVCVARDATAAMSDAIFDIEITEGEVALEASVTMSVATYATTVLEGEYTDADKSLVKYVINYANEAANYANLPNAELAALAEQYAVEIGEQTYESSADMSALAGIVTDASVILGNAPGFVFYVAEGVTELTVNGKVYAAVDGVVLVTDIRAYDFLNDVTVASGDKTGTYDFEAFAAYHAGSEEPASVAAMSVIEAVYAYVTEAAAYNAAKNA